MDSKKALLIVNPCAGRNNKRLGALEIVKKFSPPEWETEIRTTRCQGDATTIVKDEGAKYDVILCCGGDGTLNEVINGLMKLDKKIPVGYIPSGSTNDLANTLGIPTELGASADLIQSGKKNSYDLGTLNGRYFTYVAGFGTLAEVSYSTPQDIKNALGFSAYILEGLSALTTIESFNLSYEADERSGEGEYLLGLVTNTLHVAGFKNIVSSNVLLNDGLFEVLLVKKPKTASDLQKIASSILSRNFDNECIESFKTAKITVTAKDKPLSWTLDGENGGEHLVSRIEIHERALNIMTKKRK